MQFVILMDDEHCPAGQPDVRTFSRCRPGEELRLLGLMTLVLGDLEDNVRAQLARQDKLHFYEERG